MSLRVLSLFSGVGGMDLGLEWAGMRVVGQVEKDEYCRRVLARHWPEVPRHDDVRTTVDWWTSRDRPTVDLIAGGFPCQPVSVAGLRRGRDDERWLWPAFAATIRALRPGHVLVENVSGLRNRGLGDVLGDLAACGYDTWWDCVPAAAVGAPHVRDRVFIIARLANSHGQTGRPETRSTLPAGSGGPVSVRASEPGRRGSDVANAKGDRRQPRWTGDPGQGPGGRQPGRGGIGPDVADALRSGSPITEPGRPVFRPATQSSWWATEPDVGRVADGIPHRVDRLRALGNAVVPQCAEHIGRLILAGAEAVTA